MIRAADWLDSVALHDDEEVLFAAALRAIMAESEQVKREYTGFKVAMPMPALTFNVAAALRIHLFKDGWDCQAHQVQEQSQLGPARPAWLILMMPTDAVSFAATVRFKGHEN